MKALIKALLTSHWAIETQYARSYHGVVEKLLSHEDIGVLKDQEQGGKAQFLGSAGFLFDDEIEDEEEKEGNINVIPIKGVIVKYDTLCEMGTSTMAQMIEEGEANDAVDFHLLDIDSGGGVVDGTAHFANIIHNAKKPVIAFVNGMCASAAYWIASQADIIIANDQTTMVGSIGTMISYRDFSEAMKKAGVKDVSIYATASTHKNKEEEALYDDDEKPMISLLDRLNDQFLSAVKRGRKDINQSETLTGKIFVGSESLDVGLIDRLGTLEQAIDLGFSLSNNNMFSSDDKKKEIFAEIGSFFGINPKGKDKQKEETMENDKLKTEILELKEEITGKSTELESLEEKLSLETKAKEKATEATAEALGTLESYRVELGKAADIIADYKVRENTGADEEVQGKAVVPSNGNAGEYQAVERGMGTPFSE